MGSVEIFIAILLVFAGLLPGAGYGAISVTPADFRKARFCFYAAALCAWGAIILWGLTTIQPLWARLLVVAVLGAAVLVMATEGLRWLNGRENVINAVGNIDRTDNGGSVPAATKLSEITPVKIPVVLRLQFRGGQQAPIEVRSENVLSWYTV